MAPDYIKKVFTLIFIKGGATYRQLRTLTFTLMIFLLISTYIYPVNAEKESQSPSALLNSDERMHIYANGQKVAVIEGNNIEYIFSDIIGSSRLAADQSGSIVYEAEYYPFGEIINEIGSQNYGFAGKELDKTELQYFGARYYDQDTGRFTQIDPIGPGYEYANNNPMKFIDPDGRDIRLAVNQDYVDIMPLEEQKRYVEDILKNFAMHPETSNHLEKLKEINAFGCNVLICLEEIPPSTDGSNYLAITITPARNNNDDVLVVIDPEAIVAMEKVTGKPVNVNAVLAHELLGHVYEYVSDPEKYRKGSIEDREKYAEKIELKFDGGIHKLSEREINLFKVEKSNFQMKRVAKAFTDSILTSMKNNNGRSRRITDFNSVMPPIEVRESK